ncbi:MAG TPA: MerR family transcriptional regulator [Flavisolibacter sp.]|nr:MerR family transcriptional regulator [Flavisolibacter sp.]
MQKFTIRDIENLTGIKAHTLRIWEQRYGFFKAQRKESLHRFYDNEDLKKLLRISFLYHQGMKISRIAALKEQDMLSLIRKTKAAENNQSLFVASLLEAAIDFNEDAFTHTLQAITKEIGFEKCITEVCYPYLRRLGMLWSTNNIIPAQEHFSSYLIQNRIIAETEKLPGSGKLPEIVLICPEGEFHELPLLFIHYLLKKRGWSVIYLGTNVKKSEIVSLASVTSIRYLYLHLITNFTGTGIDEYLEDICRSFSAQKVFASGEGARQVQRSFVNLHLLKSDADIYRFIDRTGLQD